MWREEREGEEARRDNVNLNEFRPPGGNAKKNSSKSLEERKVRWIKEGEDMHHRQGGTFPPSPFFFPTLIFQTKVYPSAAASDEGKIGGWVGVSVHLGHFLLIMKRQGRERAAGLLPDKKESFFFFFRMRAKKAAPPPPSVVRTALYRDFACP